MSVPAALRGEAGRRAASRALRPVGRLLPLALLLLLACVPSIRRARPPAPPRTDAGAGVSAPPAPPSPPPVRPLPVELGPPPEALAAPSATRITLAAVGDVMLQDGVLDSARAQAGGDDTAEGYATLFAPVTDELSAPDLLFANLETPVAPLRGKKVQAGHLSFNAPPAAVQALRDAGLDLVSVANNHIYDRKRRGLLQTLAHLDVLGVWHVGVGPTPWEAGPRVLDVEGVRVAFLAWTQVLNRDDFNVCREPRCPKVAVLRDWEPAEAAVRAAAAQADVVVVSLHWGREYERQPGPGEEGLARRLADAGAHVVLGHHPHVLQPLELYRRADGRVSLLAYSLGNFVSNQGRDYRHTTWSPSAGDTRDGALVRVELVRWRDAEGRTQVALAGVDALPLWTERTGGEGGAPAHIRVVALARALAEARDARGLPGGAAAEDAGELAAREQLYETRLARIAARLGEGFVRPPAPLPPPPARPVATFWH